MAKHQTARAAFTKIASIALAAGIVLGSAPAAHAQFAGTPDRSSFRDTSMLKPPAGQKVAIVEFVDLECPACAYAHPLVMKAAARYHVPIVRYDFPLQMHVWSKDAAVFARYLQEKVNPGLADDYRTAVFAAQASIASKDDLQNFTRRFMSSHGQSMPFVVDPTGQLLAKVMSDYHLGERLNVSRTPTIVVATDTKWQIVSGSETGSNDVNRIDAILQGALKQTGSAPVVAHTAAPAKH
jgi:protein-disulfide isomerase